MVKYSLLCSFPVRSQTQTVKANAVLRLAVKLPHFQFLYNLNSFWKQFRQLRRHFKCSFVTAECFHAGFSFLEFFLMTGFHPLEYSTVHRVATVMLCDLFTQKTQHNICLFPISAYFWINLVSQLVCFLLFMWNTEASAVKPTGSDA